MYLCEICGTCSKPKTSRLHWWGFLGHYHELSVCTACHKALKSGRTIRDLLAPERRAYASVTNPVKVALPQTSRRI